jgi:excisionase family DNA binding protein
MTDSDLMTLEQVAKYLKLKPQTIYKWAQEGKIPAAKLGKEWRFRRTILDEWINTSIHLSNAGFDLMVDRSWLQIKNSGVSAADIDKIIESRWNKPATTGEDE